jgi:hypothetical protein
MRCEDAPGRSMNLELPGAGESDPSKLSVRCGVARFLDREDLTDDEKFKHLALLAKRSGKWGAATLGWMSMFSQERFEEYVVSRGDSFRAEEVMRLCGSDGWDIMLRGKRSSNTAKVKSILFHRAMKEPDPQVRAYALGFVSNHAPTLEESLALARKLGGLLESESGSREAIIAAQVWHDHPDTNRIVRKALAEPLEPSILGILCEYDLVRQNRYDFLPDLYALRKRLEDEKDIVKRDASREALAAVNRGIAALEDLKRKGAPIAGAAAPTGAAP